MYGRAKNWNVLWLHWQAIDLPSCALLLVCFAEKKTYANCLFWSVFEWMRAHKEEKVKFYALAHWVIQRDNRVYIKLHDVTASQSLLVNFATENRRHKQKWPKTCIKCNSRPTKSIVCSPIDVIVCKLHRQTFRTIAIAAAFFLPWLWLLNQEITMKNSISNLCLLHFDVIRIINPMEFMTQSAKRSTSNEKSYFRWCAIKNKIEIFQHRLKILMAYLPVWNDVTFIKMVIVTDFRVSLI